MGSLIGFELKKIVGNRSGMVACALMFVLLVGVAALNVATTGVRDYESGEYVQGLTAQRSLHQRAERHTGLLTDERVNADAQAYDHAIELWEQQSDLLEKGSWESAGDEAITHGVDFWRETAGVFTDDYYGELVNALDFTDPRPTSLEAASRAKLDAGLNAGFWGYFPYTKGEQDFWRGSADKIAWPLEYGYQGGWHNVLMWKGFSGLATVALCIAVSGVFAGEYRERTAAIVLPTKRGKRELPLAKVAAVLIFTTAYWWLLTAAVIAMHVGLAGVQGWNLPLQIAYGYDNAYPLTLGETIVASYALGYLVSLGAAAFALLLSSKMRSTMPVAATCMAIVFLGIISLFATPLVKLGVLTPFSGMSYAFDYPISYALGPLVLDLPSMLALLYGAALVLLAPLAVRTFVRHQLA